MEEKALIVYKEETRKQMKNKCNELRERMHEKTNAYENGVKDATAFILRMAEDNLIEMEDEVDRIMFGMKVEPVKTIGVAEWELDENGHLICSHCGGEAWARKYNDSGEGKQMPSQHCPWCGYEMRAYQ